jgi:hypothetical protein
MAPKQCGKFHNFSRSSEVANHPVVVVVVVVGICRRNRKQHGSPH